jgi:hypothetical protein
MLDEGIKVCFFFHLLWGVFLSLDWADTLTRRSASEQMCPAASRPRSLPPSSMRACAPRPSPCPYRLLATRLAPRLLRANNSPYQRFCTSQRKVEQTSAHWANALAHWPPARRSMRSSSARAPTRATPHFGLLTLTIRLVWLTVVWARWVNLRRCWNGSYSAGMIGM